MTALNQKATRAARPKLDGLYRKFYNAREKATRHFTLIPDGPGPNRTQAYSILTRSHEKDETLPAYHTTTETCTCVYEGLCAHIIAVRDMEIPGHDKRFLPPAQVPVEVPPASFAVAAANPAPVVPISAAQMERDFN